MQNLAVTFNSGAGFVLDAPEKIRKGPVLNCDQDTTPPRMVERRSARNAATIRLSEEHAQRSCLYRCLSLVGRVELEDDVIDVKIDGAFSN